METVFEKDYSSRSIGVGLIDENGEYCVSNLIYQHTPIPCSYNLQAATLVANQSSVFLEIYENNSGDQYVDKSICKLLFKGELGPLPKNLPAHTPIELIFNINKDGLLTIDVEHKETGVRQNIYHKELLSVDEETAEG